MRRTLIAALVLGSACGGDSSTNSPVGPSPPPDPAPPATVVTVRLTDTVTGAPIGESVHEVSALPAALTLTHPGYVTRETWVSGPQAQIDLIPEAGFDLAFYRQFARGTQHGRTDPLRVRTDAPSFYMEVEGAKGLSASVAARLEQVARRLVPELTGGRFTVAQWETGPTTRDPQPGWIVIARDDNLGGPDLPPNRVVCGRATIGGSAGQIWIHGDQVCRIEAVFAHELGHALGFWHVDRLGALMYPQELAGSAADAPTELERRHAAIAYARQPGNADIDRDSRRPARFSTRVVVN